MRKPVRKAVIPAAGFGTRFLPATKSQPKEMLPIVDKPTIQYIIEEAIASGIEEILIVTSTTKRSIEDHFDKSYELEDTLAKKGKTEMLEMVQNIYEKNKNRTEKSHNHLLQGFIYCKECGRTIGINTRGKTGYCVCNYYRKYSKEKACTPHRIRYDILEKMVLNEIKKMFRKINSSKFEDKIRNSNKVEKKIISLEKENAKLKIEIDSSQRKDDDAYMDKLNNLITFDTYKNIHNRILEERQLNKNKLEENLKQIAELKNNTINRDYQKIVNDYISLKKPNRKVLSNIIDRIELDENLNIDIYYRFKKPI